MQVSSRTPPHMAALAPVLPYRFVISVFMQPAEAIPDTR